MRTQTLIERQCVEDLTVARLAINEDEPIHFGYSRNQLKEAFDRVANRDNWKSPIDNIVALADVQVTMAAISFYTGSLPAVTLLPDGLCAVQAIGYYLAVGA